MDSNKEKMIVHLLENINEKLGEVSEKVDSDILKEKLNHYKYHFAEARARLKNGYEFK